MSTPFVKKINHILLKLKLASIKDAYKTILKTRKPLILLTFLGWHLLRTHNTYCASLIDATPKNPDVVRLLGFFVPIFHSAILIDAKRQKRRVDGI